MATRMGRKWNFDPCCHRVERGALSPFLSILADNINIVGADTEMMPPGYIARTLVDRGAIAYLRRDRTWAAFANAGRKWRTGAPRYIRLIGDNGQQSDVMEARDEPDAEICIIPANAYFCPPRRLIEEKVETLYVISTAMAQNVDALRQCALIIYDDPALKDAVEKAEKERLAGARTVSLCRTLSGAQVDIGTFTPNGVQDFIPSLLAAWSQTMDELDAAAGIVNIGDKQERRTDDEIAAIVGGSSALVRTTTHTFTKYCEFYGIDAHAHNGAECKDDGITSPEEETAGDQSEEGENNE